MTGTGSDSAGNARAFRARCMRRHPSTVGATVGIVRQCGLWHSHPLAAICRVRFHRLDEKHAPQKAYGILRRGLLTA